MLSDFAEKKETCFDYKKQNFSKSKTIHFYNGKPVYAFGQKMPFFLQLDLVKITLQIMLNYFEEKKETFFDYKKDIFSKSKKSHFFFKGVNPCFWPKNIIFSLFRFDQNKTRNNAF